MSIQKITKIALFIALIAAFEPLCWGAANPEREIGLLAQLYKDSDHVASGVLASLGNPELQQLARIGRKESERFPKLYQDVMGELLKRKIKQLLQENFGNAQDALFDAAENNKAWAIDYLVQNGANVNATGGQDRETALMGAAESGHEGVVARLLAAAGVDVNAVNSTGMTPLMWAASSGHEGVVAQLLAAAGVNVNATNSQGRTALMFAAGRGHEGVVAQLLAAAGVDVNAVNNGGNTALMFAAFWGHEGVVAQLLAAGAGVNAVNNGGNTALMKAVERGHGAVAAQLIAAGADFDDLEIQELKAMGVEIGG